MFVRFIALSQAYNELQFWPFRPTRLAGVNDDGSLSMWDLGSPKDSPFRMEQLHQGPAKGVSFSPRFKYTFTTVGLDKMVKVFDINTKNCSMVMEMKADVPLTSVSMTEGNLIVAGAANGSMVFFDLRTNNLLGTIPAHAGGPMITMSQSQPEWVSASYQESKSAQFAPHTNPASISARPTSSATPIPDPASIREAIGKANASETSELMGMFSPVNNAPKRTVRRPDETAAQIARLSKLGTHSISALSSSFTDRSSLDEQPAFVSPSLRQSEINVRKVQSSDAMTALRRSDNVQPNPTNTLLRAAVSGGLSSNKSSVETSNNFADPFKSEPIPRPHSTSGTRDTPIDRRTSSGSGSTTIRPRSASGSMRTVNDHFESSYGEIGQFSGRRVPGTSGFDDKDSGIVPTPTGSVTLPGRSATPPPPASKIVPQTSENAKNVTTAKLESAGPLFWNKLMTSGWQPGKTEVGTDESSLRKDIRSDESGVVPLTSSQGVSSFQSQLLENIIEDSLQDFRMEIRKDIQNVHLEVLRQFHFLRCEMEEMMEKYSATAPLLAEIERLREENDRLKHNY
ncbi:hypothetical protein BJ742DRAFT_444895 [Cladochytrium replicatum]|nr:hypothetical protein BJ742DRAFT_444895 [Cladochytrium replicatum]